MLLRGLAWIGARSPWVLAVGVVLATLLPSLSAFLRPLLPGLVVMVLCVSAARLDLGELVRRAGRPRRLTLLLVWTVALLVVLPAIIWAGATAAGLPPAHIAALVYTFAAPPIASSSALCLILGLDAVFALELTVVASLATPVLGPPVIKALLGESVPLDATDLALRVAAMLAAGVVAALILRRLAGPDRIARNASAFDGVTALVLLVFVIPLFDGFWSVIANMPWFALGALALVLVANWGVQIAVALAARRGGVEAGMAGSAGLMAGNRNVTIYLAALPPDPLFSLYVAFYQMPMLFTPLVLGRVLRRG